MIAPTIIEVATRASASTIQRIVMLGAALIIVLAVIGALRDRNGP